MKKIFLLPVLVLFAISVFGQSKSELEEKGRKQIKTGFIIMGVGAGIALGGLLIDDGDSESSVNGILILGGVALLVTGIMIAVLGGEKKSRAWRMVGSVENVPAFKNGNLVKQAIPSIGLRIPIGR